MTGKEKLIEEFDNVSIESITSLLCGCECPRQWGLAQLCIVDYSSKESCDECWKQALKRSYD